MPNANMSRPMPYGETFVIEQSTKPSSIYSRLTGGPNRVQGVSGFDGEKGTTTALPLLRFGQGIQGDEGSLQRAADLRKLRPHRVSERHGL
jgi:hypothetical protein